MLELKTDKMLAEKAAGIGWMTFNNPARRNATSLEMWQAIADILGDFAADPAVRVVVMRGAGDKAFVSGADISQFEDQRADAQGAARYNEIAERARAAMAALDKPLIAMIHGYCLGGGVAIAMAADMRFAADDSIFGIPAARLGISYGFGYLKKLVDLVGPAYAKEILLTARRFSAEEALGIGLGLRRDRRQCAALHRRQQGDHRRGGQGPGLARHGAHRGAGADLLRQRRLRRGPPRLHGKAQAGVEGGMSGGAAGDAAMTRQADWYFDFVSPFSYLQFEAFGRLPADLAIALKPVLFAGLLGHWEHKGPAEIPAKRRQTYRYCHWLAGKRGIPFKTPPRHPFNPLAVLRLAIALGAEPAAVATIFRHIWAEGNDGQDPDSLAALAASLGVQDLDDRVGDPEVKRKLRANTDEAIARGVFGVPSFVVDEEIFWGEDATGMLLDFLDDPELFRRGDLGRLDDLPAAARRKQSRL
jgi:enoyl-CoA hydratase/carnithine racemase/2-hydroxychromene-2-carboxylate isomerase